MFILHCLAELLFFHERIIETTAALGLYTTGVMETCHNCLGCCKVAAVAATVSASHQALGQFLHMPGSLSAYNVQHNHCGGRDSFTHRFSVHCYFLAGKSEFQRGRGTARLGVLCSTAKCHHHFYFCHKVIGTYCSCVNHVSHQACLLISRDRLLSAIATSTR